MLRPLLSPAASDTFTGRSDEVRFFQRFILDVKSGSETRRAVLVSGIPGIGKSSLLNKFRDIASVEGVTTIPLTVSFSRARTFFEEVKKRLDSLAPGARKKLIGEKPFAAPPPLPKEVDSAFEELFIGRFMEDMDKVKEAITRPVFFFCDSFERFAWLGYNSAYPLFRRVLSVFAESGFPAFFVVAAERDFVGEIVGGASNLFHVVELGPMPISDMRVLIQKLSGKLGFKVEEKVVDEMIKDSGGIPYKLCLLLYSSLAVSGERGVTYESLRKASELLKENPLGGIFQISGDETFVIDRIISGEYNFAPLDAIKQSLGDIFESTIASLKEKGLVEVEDSFILLVSDALFHDLRLSVNVDQIYGKASILLKLILKTVESGMPVNETIVNWFKDSATILAARKLQSLVVELASSVEDAAKEALEKRLFYDACVLFNIAADLHRRLGDYERAGMVLDAASRLFFDAGKLHYARVMLAQASELYEKSGVEWRAKSSARSAARMFEDAGDEYFKAGSLMLSRVFYRRAAEYLIKAGDSAHALSLCEKALKSFRGNKALERDFRLIKEKIGG
ncbi:MAG: ATP-binding protein [Candidatus Jordarchaeales archaeon]